MRTLSQIRDRAQQGLQFMLTRPSMFGTDSSYEGTVRSQLLDLAFIDDRDADLQAAFDQLRADGLFTALGTYGALAAALGGQSDYTNELASIYARVAAHMGYFEPARRLTPEEWERACAHDYVAERCATPSDVIERLGPPSYQNAATSPPVLAYAGASDHAWLYFDFRVRHEERTLMRVRRPISPFRASVVPAGEVSNAGPDSPEEAYRKFFVAMLSGDEARLAPMVVQHESLAQLYDSAYPDEVAELLANQYQNMDVFRTAPPPTTIFVASEAFPFPTAVVHDGDSWRVDADALLSFRTKKGVAPSGPA